MRKSHLQPSGQHHQLALSSKEQREGESSKWREKRSISDGAKKTDATETKKPIEDINASADAFIKNFRQQLLIQRLQSIENYEQMLARGL
ncbi:hypothetical protein E2542_SST25504 [Spatholobus suberectus]|nr:hypothetical protein E2542_SST25504 [Spatholobus suberectus]